MQVPRERNHPRPAALPDAREPRRAQHHLEVDHGRLVPRQLVHAHNVLLVHEVPLLEHAYRGVGRVVDRHEHVAHVAPQPLDVAALARGNVQHRELVREELLAHVEELRLVRVPVLDRRVVLGADVHAEKAAARDLGRVLPAPGALVQPVQDTGRQLADVARELRRQPPVALEIGPVVGGWPRELHAVVEAETDGVLGGEGNAAAGLDDEFGEPDVEGRSPHLGVQQDVRPLGGLEGLRADGEAGALGRDVEERVTFVDEAQLGTVGLHGVVEMLCVEYVAER